MLLQEHEGGRERAIVSLCASHGHPIESLLGPTAITALMRLRTAARTELCPACPRHIRPAGGALGVDEPEGAGAGAAPAA
jgi:hypothetical protein